MLSMSGDRNTTTIFPLPIELLQAFTNQGKAN